MSDSESGPGECVSLTVELAAHREKLQRETITLWDGKDPRSEVRIVLQGRVLGERAIPDRLREFAHYHVRLR